MLNNKRTYLNYVTMIDSQCDSNRNPPMISTNNNNFYRSPLRDRQNKLNLSNVSNTPLRSGKASLSPLRMRKAEISASGMAINNSIMRNNSTMSKRKQPVVQKQEESCFNHPQKIAKFYVQAPEEVMYCCQKCAILLASQGFKVCKLQASFLMEQSCSQIASIRKQSHSRKIQIQQFMSRLQSLSVKLKSNESNLQQIFSKSQTQLQMQLNKIQDYYEQFYQILNQHKKRVVLQVKQQFQRCNQKAYDVKKEAKQAVYEVQSMKKDILDSWDDIILVAQEHQYRPVMNAYNQKLQNYQNIVNNGQNFPQLTVRKLDFKNTDLACEALEKGLQVQWEDQDKEEQETPRLEQQSSQMDKYSKQSDLPQNPVEFLQRDEKFIKSSLKDLVGLFSSFQE